jgi:hypothetical protein
MRATLLPGRVAARLLAALAAVTLAALAWVGGESRLAAGPINPKVYKTKFDEARKGAEVVASVRVLAATCTEAAGAGKMRSVTLELALQVLEAEKGPVKKNDVVVVRRKVNLPAGPGPGMYGYWAALQQFPFTPGVRGDVALTWNKEARRYDAVAGWVADPNKNPRAIPTEVGKAYTDPGQAGPKMPGPGAPPPGLKPRVNGVGQ